MNKLDKQYQQLLQDIIDFGVEKKDRTGTGTKSIFGYTIRHKMSDGFPLLTTKKMAWKTMVTELLWFLRGDTNIKYLVDNNCHIWDGDAYKRYADSHTTFKDGFAMVTPMAHSRESFIEAIKTDDEFARVLYSALRAADEQGLETVVVAQPSGDGIAIAIRDRLKRAAHYE
jgi:thymidylate synthase